MRKLMIVGVLLAVSACSGSSPEAQTAADIADILVNECPRIERELTKAGADPKILDAVKTACDAAALQARK